ncbi:MAG: radical SAM protein [Desulfobacterales bacterium]|jgi:radical SAM superfamily enzyme YgiQ (UPF0313 family)
MKIALISMPDVAPVIMHESAFHMPNCGIASIGANVDPGHSVYVVDLVRRRRHVRQYLQKTLAKIRPDVVGLSTMTWQYGTCVKIVRQLRRWLPNAKIALGGYHPTLMYEEIGQSEEGQMIDFLVRGEGEETFRRLVNALDGKDRLHEIPGLSFKDGGQFVHNPPGDLLDLSRVRLPIRDERRLTDGYHVMNFKCEVMETSRGCTRTCNFCSIRHMYGRSYRTYPIRRVLADLDDIYFGRRTRWVFVSDDNFVLDVERALKVCDAIARRGYPRLQLIVQADCVTMARNEHLVAAMARAGFRSVFLGMESASRRNLAAAKKGDIIDASRQAVENCHKHGIMVVAGMIFGFPDDEEQDIEANYRFLKEVDADTDYCQILTPYPKTGIRKVLMDEGLVTNAENYARYNGMWANVKTRHLNDGQLQFLVWYHRETTMGWWTPSARIRAQGPLWTGIWLYVMRPLMKKILDRKQQRIGWKGRFKNHLRRLVEMNRFPDLE